MYVKDVIEETFVSGIEDDYLASSDTGEKVAAVTNICQIGKVINDSEKTKLAYDSDMAKLSLERDKLSFEKEKLSLEVDKLSVEKEKLSMEKEKLSIDEQKFESEAEFKRKEHAWDVIKHVVGWAITIGTGLATIAYKSRMLNKTFRFEETGTISSQTGRSIFHDI